MTENNSIESNGVTLPKNLCPEVITATGKLTISANTFLNHDYVFRNTVTGQEMLKVSSKGFFVRGELIEQNEEEAKKVYDAFKAFLGING